MFIYELHTNILTKDQDFWNSLSESEPDDFVILSL